MLAWNEVCGKTLIMGMLFLFRRGGAGAGIGLPRLTGTKRGSLPTGSSDDSSVLEDSVDGEEAPN